MSEVATLAQALLEAQKDMPPVDRDGINPHFSSRFTTLDNLIAKTRPVLNSHGITLVQMPSQDEQGKPSLTTRLIHESGESLEATMPLLLTKSDPQALGSALTYAKRYALAAVLAIADQEDDDGNAATAAQNGGDAPTFAAGFASDKQRGFFAAQLKKAGVDGAGVDVVCEYLDTRPKPDVKTAIDTIAEGTEEKREEMRKRLESAASLWAEKAPALEAVS